MAALLPLLLLIPLWLLLVRPQQRRIRAQQAVVRSLQVGDDVLTSSGIYGSIVDLDGDVATLEVAEGVNIRIARMAIGSRLNPHADEIAAAADDPEEDLAPPDNRNGDEPGSTIRPPGGDES